MSTEHEPASQIRRGEQPQRSIPPCVFCSYGPHTDASGHSYVPREPASGAASRRPAVESGTADVATSEPLTDEQIQLIRKITNEWTDKIVEWVVDDIKTTFLPDSYDPHCLRKQVLYCLTHALNDWSDKVAASGTAAEATSEHDERRKMQGYIPHKHE